MSTSPSFLTLPPQIRTNIYSYLTANHLTRFEHVHILNDIPLSHPLTRTCKHLRHECALFPRPVRPQNFAQTKYLHVDVQDFDFTRFLEWFGKLQNYQGRWWRSERFAPTLRRVEFTIEVGSPRLSLSSSSKVAKAGDGDRMRRFEVGIEGMLNRPKKLLRCAAGTGLVIVEFRVLFNWDQWRVEDAERMYDFVQRSEKVGGPERYRLRMAILRALNERKGVLGLEVQSEREEFGTHWKRGRLSKSGRRQRDEDGDGGTDDTVRADDVVLHDDNNDGDDDESDEEKEDEDEEQQDEDEDLPMIDGMDEDEKLEIRELDGTKVKLARKSRAPEIVGSENED
ncbi:hypothetical protein KC332_g13025 [Hortaea werneckii]|nr:hypothetical protein KC350_g13629 [Hortaea werneckii]KAI6812123.1 hypothetical protein KC358_g11818 [Hortaea werneckii]KAI6915523.1 hypothetical protein KC348_g11993 [Hortaea werneckii]KAI6926453.1 hypothetical protein KC341_g12774 [Hortaea werneckii]KAI6960609.1 hypothetical protein KC321_g12762 [Hortaea werneckii]